MTLPNSPVGKWCAAKNQRKFEARSTPLQKYPKIGSATNMQLCLRISPSQIIARDNTGTYGGRTCNCKLTSVTPREEQIQRRTFI
jgi:hypothetical protein